MIEIKGNLWDYLDKPNTVICITTNGTIKKNGEAVMGRGCAKEAALKWPNLPALLGHSLRLYGNVPSSIDCSKNVRILTFPVKYNWYETANKDLISFSAGYLSGIASVSTGTTYILPRPGCGNGHLSWEEVKPLISFLPDNVHVISF